MFQHLFCIRLLSWSLGVPPRCLQDHAFNAETQDLRTTPHRIHQVLPPVSSDVQCQMLSKEDARNCVLDNYSLIWCHFLVSPQKLSGKADIWYQWFPNLWPTDNTGSTPPPCWLKVWWEYVVDGQRCWWLAVLCWPRELRNRCFNEFLKSCLI